MTIDRTKFERYAEIKKAIKAMEAEAKEIQDEVVAEMATNQLKKVESDFGTFFFTARKSWQYPAYVTEAEAHYKELKEKAETIGEATYTETQSLSFRGKESD